MNITARLVSSPVRHWLSVTHEFFESYDEPRFQPGTKLFDELLEIASPTYQDPYKTILHTVHGSNKLYILRNEMQNGPIICCSFVQYGHKLTLKDSGRTIPVVYHNLAMSNEKVKNTGLIKQLFEYLHYELQKQKRRQPQLPVLLYYVTPTPSIFYLVDQIIENNVPSLNDYNREVFTDQEWHITNELKKLRNWPIAEKSSNGNPFVLKGVMQSRYTAKERMRIEKIVKIKSFKVFDDLGIDESNGDRLLRYVYI